MPFTLKQILLIWAFLSVAAVALAQYRASPSPMSANPLPVRGTPVPVRGVPVQTRAAPTPLPLFRKPAELIRKQEPVKVNQKLLKQATPDQVRVVVSLPKQRAYLMWAEQVVIDSPISSGKRGHGTPAGKFTVMERDPNHHSSLYGDFVDSSGRVVRAGVSAQIDSAPSGTHFAGAPMKWFVGSPGTELEFAL